MIVNIFFYDGSHRARDRAFGGQQTLLIMWHSGSATMNGYGEGVRLRGRFRRAKWFIAPMSQSNSVKVSQR
jgi:hypothetical protein